MGRENLLGSRIRNDVDRLKMKLPQLFKTTDLETEHGWRWLMEDFVHIWFHIDDTYYFLFPEGAHRYGLSYYSDNETGNFPRWQFKSETEFLNAKIFSGKSVLERLGEFMSYEP